MKTARLLTLLAVCAAAVLIAADEPAPTPEAPAPVYSLTPYFSTDLPPGCLKHAQERFAEFRRTDRLHEPHYDIVFVGDSLVESWQPLPRTAPLTAVNRGVSCDLTLGLHERLLRDVVAYRPKAAVIFTGVNDLAQRYREPPRDRAFGVVHGLTAVAMRLQGHGIKPVVLSVLPTRLAFPGLTVRTTNELIRDVNNDLLSNCRRLGVPFWDLTRAMADSTGQLREDFTDDGLHINTAAYTHLNRIVGPKLQALSR